MVYIRQMECGKSQSFQKGANCALMGNVFLNQEVRSSRNPSIFGGLMIPHLLLFCTCTPAWALSHRHKPNHTRYLHGNEDSPNWSRGPQKITKLSDFFPLFCCNYNQTPFITFNHVPLKSGRKCIQALIIEQGRLQGGKNWGEKGG